MKKVIISSCLLGNYCRYDGKTKIDSQLVNDFKEYEIIPFCPEAPLFGTPRGRISVVNINGEHRIIKDETDEDVTQKLEDAINSFIDKNQEVDEIVLKSKSPSCGLGTTPILDKDKNIIKYHNGIGADMMLKKYPNIKINDENNYKE